MLTDEILIEFGGSIGAPYGRDQYTRMGHIQVINQDDLLDYGLNSNGAVWTANASYTGYYSTNIGLPAGTSMHYNNATGAKWYNCKFSKGINLDTLTCWSGNYSDSYYVDFPHHVKVTLRYQGINVGSFESDFTQPTDTAQQNIVVSPNPILVKGLMSHVSVFKEYPLSVTLASSGDIQSSVADPTILSFDGSTLRALNLGKTTLTFTSNIDSTISKTYNITVTNTLYKIYTCDYIDEGKLNFILKIEVIK